MITVASFRTMPVFLTAALSTFASAIFFASLLTVQRGWRWPPRRCMHDILIASFIIGVAYYAIFYLGFKYTTAGNGAVVALMEVFFSFLIISVIRKHDPLIPSHVAGAGMMLAGALFILIPRTAGWHGGDLIILCATAIPPLGNMAMQRARKEASAAYIMFWRSFISSLFLFFLFFLFEKAPSSSALVSILPLTLVTGMFVLGLSKIFWIEAIHRIPVTKTISLVSIQPLFTLLFASLFLHETPTIVQLFSFFPMAIGMFLLMGQPRKVVNQSPNDLFNE